jgi:histidinol dehydrogenase
MSSKKTSGQQALLRAERLATMTPQRKRSILRRSSTKLERTLPFIKRVMADVRRNGDSALVKYSQKFDRADLSSIGIRVSRSEIRNAYKIVARDNPDLVPAIKTTLECIGAFHKGELDQLKCGMNPWKRTVGSRKWSASSKIAVGQLRTPIDCVGVYVPGGNAVLLTTALMAITPAKVAGVPRIVVASPPSRDGNIDPRIIVAADLAGADVMVRAGGAQAIAAMAYGTESVPAVAKIVGPGNIYVAAAKAYVAGNSICAIDLPAGPSEVLVIADATANAEYIAKDMLSQSEHDTDACAVLVTTSIKLARLVRTRLLREFKRKPGQKQSIAERSLSRYGAIIVVKSLKEAVDVANEFAPEHLQIMTKKPRALLSKIRNAGGIFLGNYSPTAIGDYVCPNHILPTGGAARYTSGVSMSTFLKTPSFLEVPQKAIRVLNELVETLSKAEGLYEQHGRSVRARLK